jgi:hypothetical protein
MAGQRSCSLAGTGHPNSQIPAEEQIVLNFEADWSRPINLIDGSKQKLVFALKDPEALPEEAGIYVFCRIWGQRPVQLTPLYIGKAANIRARIRQHIEGNVRLMQGIKDPEIGNGSRGVIWCTVRARAPKKCEKILDVLERGLIQHALSEGHELLNVKLTKLKAHSVQFTGNRMSEQLAPRRMLIRAA